MINIKINDITLEKHRSYLKKSRLLQNLKELLNENFQSSFMKDHSAFCKRLIDEYYNMSEGGNENIFLGSPAYLQTFISKVSQNYKTVQAKIEENEKYSTLFYSAFGYEQFVNSHGPVKPSNKDSAVNEYTTLENFGSIESNFKWGAYAYVLSLNIKVCPYCNRNYVTPLYSENGKMRADLDHFFSKSKYPYLSISIYNLVPSCKYCNSSLKGQKDFTYDGNFHPLDEIKADNLYRMTYIPRSVDCFLGKADFEIELEYNRNEKNWPKMKGNDDVFHIRQIYQYHKDIVARFLKKRYIYDDGYIEYLLNTYPNLFSTKEDVVTFLLAPYDISQAENTPLGKLMKDLIEEMDF